jgi:hypothetical protein
MLALPRKKLQQIEKIEFGSLRQTTPIGGRRGFDRGRPIDRYYIENFLRRHADDIRGRVLEFHGNSYTKKIGGNRVTKSDVLNVEEHNPKSTFVGDLATAHHVPANAFDCIVMTQVLQTVRCVSSRNAAPSAKAQRSSSARSAESM